MPSKENNGPKLYEQYLKEYDQAEREKDPNSWSYNLNPGPLELMLNALATQLHSLEKVAQANASLILEQGKRIEELEERINQLK